MRFAFAGGRDIAVRVLEYLLGAGYRPEALLVPASSSATHDQELVELCGELEPRLVFRCADVREREAVAERRDLDLDLIVSVHVPHIFPPELLAVPKLGAVNLHPAFLPFNRGWHTPTWALLEDTPVGATLHFMDQGVDTGDIIHPRRLPPSPGDTAHTLCQRLKLLELTGFQEAGPRLVAGTYTRIPQEPAGATVHRRRDVFDPCIPELAMDERVRTADLLRRLRALTTNRVDEAAYFEQDGRRFRVQLTITEEPAE